MGVDPLEGQPALAGREQGEQDVAAQVHVVRVVRRRAHEPLVVGAIPGRDGLDVRHERPRPEAVPREPDGRVEGRRVREREDGLLGQFPRLQQDGRQVRPRPLARHRGDGGTDVRPAVELEAPQDLVVRVERDEFGRARPADVRDRRDAVVAEERQPAPGQARVGDAEERREHLVRAGGEVEVRLGTAFPQLGRQFAFPIREAELVDRSAVDGARVGIARVPVRHLPPARDERRRLDVQSVAEPRPDGVVLAVERLEARDDAERGIDGAGGVLQHAEEAQRARAGLPRDLLVVLPLADEVRAPVTADVERLRVLEARAAVVRPDVEEPEVGHLVHERRQHLGVVLADAGVRERHRVARLEGAERVIDARSAQHRVAGEELLGDRTRLEREQPGHEAVRAGQRGVSLENGEVGREVVGGVEPPVERRAHELVQRRAVRVEHRVRLALWPGFESHRVGEGVDLDVGVSPRGELADVRLRIERVLDPRFLREEDVVAGTVPREGGRDRGASLEIAEFAIAGGVEEPRRRRVQHPAAGAGETAGPVG